MDFPMSTVTGNSDVILYTRSDCCLCDVALTVLQRHGITPSIVDIDADPDLIKLYNTCVPVVMIDGKVRFKGQVNEMLLIRLLKKR